MSKNPYSQPNDCEWLPCEVRFSLKEFRAQLANAWQRGYETGRGKSPRQTHPGAVKKGE